MDVRPGDRDPRTLDALVALDPAIRPALVRRLSARDGLFRSGLLHLTRVAPRLPVQVTRADSARRAASECLARLGQPVVAELVPELTEAFRRALDPGTQDAVSHTLLLLGPRAVGPLAVLGADPEPSVRLRAMRALAQVLRASNSNAGKPGGTKDPSVRDLATALAIQLDTSNDELFIATASILSLLRSEAEVALPALSRRLGSPNPNARQAAALALGAVGRQPALCVPQLARLLGDTTEDVRAAAATALGGFAADATPAVPDLVESARHPRTSVAVASANALGRIGAAATPAVGALVEFLEHPSAVRRASAAAALGRIAGDPDLAVPALARRLDDPESDVRYQAARALAAFGGRALPALDPLVRALRDPVESVRVQAVEAIGGLGSGARTAVPFLEAARNNNQSVMNRPVLAALKRMGEVPADPGEREPNQ